MSRLIPLPFAVGFFLFAASCAAETGTPLAIPTATLRSYSNPTSSPTVVLQPIEAENETPISPSATPFFHTVVADDTLLGIALKYGLELNELLEANPGINPRILTIGQQIQIPNPQGTPGAFLPTATPLPIDYSEGRCYSTSDQAAWCVAAALNSTEGLVEGLSARFDLYDQAGKSIRSALVAAPHNLLPPGERMPMGIYFPEGIPTNSRVMIMTISAFSVQDAQERFLSFDVSWQSQEIALTEWRAFGSVAGLESNPRASHAISILVSAFGAEDELVGYRKIIFDEALDPGEDFQFDERVFSLGPPIDHVEVLVEEVAEARQE